MKSGTLLSSVVEIKDDNKSLEAAFQSILTGELLPITLKAEGACDSESFENKMRVFSIEPDEPKISKVNADGTITPRKVRIIYKVVSTEGF